MKRLMLLTVVCLMTVGLHAQSFFTPVTADMFKTGDRALTGVLLIRPEFTVAGTVFKPLYIDGKFDSFQMSFASRVGFGASYSLFKLVDGEPYNVYSFAAQVSVTTSAETSSLTEVESPNMGLLLTASAFNLWGLSPSLGVGVDFVKNTPIKQSLFFMWGLNRTF